MITPELAAVHALGTEVHMYANKKALAYAAAHLPGTEGLNRRLVMFAGTGHGVELLDAYHQGAIMACGYDFSPKQIEFARSLAERYLANTQATPFWWGNKEIERLYQHDMAVPMRAHFYVQSQFQALRRIHGETANDYLINSPLITWDSLSGPWPHPKAYDVLVGNFMLHWVVRRTSLERALDSFAPLVRPGGLAVFTLPFHLVRLNDEAEDEKLRRHCVYDTAAYHCLHNHLARQFTDSEKMALPWQTSLRQMPGASVRVSEASHGSVRWRHIATHTEYYASPYSIMDTLVGLAAYEAVIRTGKPMYQVLDQVVEALAATRKTLARTHNLGVSEAATYLYYFVFQQKE